MICLSGYAYTALAAYTFQMLYHSGSKSGGTFPSGLTRYPTLMAATPLQTRTEPPLCSTDGCRWSQLYLSRPPLHIFTMIWIKNLDTSLHKTCCHCQHISIPQLFLTIDMPGCQMIAFWESPCCCSILCLSNYVNVRLIKKWEQLCVFAIGCW